MPPACATLDLSSGSKATVRRAPQPLRWIPMSFTCRLIAVATATTPPAETTAFLRAVSAVAIDSTAPAMASKMAQPSRCVSASSGAAYTVRKAERCEVQTARRDRSWV
eukprot:3765526-Prymnesium_polylepis.1